MELSQWAITSAGVAIEAREEEPGDTNPDRKCARERLPWHDVAITNREAGADIHLNC
jgi:hypothetical protein